MRPDYALYNRLNDRWDKTQDPFVWWIMTIISNCNENHFGYKWIEREEKLIVGPILLRGVRNTVTLIFNKNTYLDGNLTNVRKVIFTETINFNQHYPKQHWMGISR